MNNSLVLGIESSCDETAVALVRGDRTILAQRIASQNEAHERFGRRGARNSLPAPMPTGWRRWWRQYWSKPASHLQTWTPIARHRRAGALIGGVMVGLVTAKALAFAAGKPLIAVNHLEGHALSPRLADASLQFPYLLLLVSGGHCQLLGVEGVGRYRRLATTIDDAVGEAFDKSAKVLGLGFPGGPALETGGQKRHAALCPAAPARWQ